jgi:hypothetical protein
MPRAGEFKKSERCYRTFNGVEHWLMAHPRTVQEAKASAQKFRSEGMSVRRNLCEVWVAKASAKERENA